MVNNYTNSNQANNHTSPQTHKILRHTILEIQLLAWDRHKNMAELNRQMGSQPPPPLDNWISNVNTYPCINTRLNTCICIYHTCTKVTWIKWSKSYECLSNDSTCQKPMTFSISYLKK